MNKCVVVVCFLSLCAAKDYTGHHVLEVTPTSKEQVQQLLVYKNDRSDVSFWSDVVAPSRPVRIQVAPEQKDDVYKALREIKLEATVTIPDIQRLINEQEKQRQKTRKRGPGFSLDKYHDLNEINRYMSKLSNVAEDVSWTSTGTSLEGRDVMLMKIGGEDKPAIFFDCTNHAREWISTAVCTNIIHDLVINPTQDKEVEELRHNFTWYFIPVLNPDGFHYTWTQDRLWRKNRRNVTKECGGVNLNRNFDAGFGGEGSSDDPCSTDYREKYAASEPETKAMIQVVQGISSRLFAQWSIHSFGQLYLLPYHFKPELPPEFDEMYRVAESAVIAARGTYGQTYFYGNGYGTLYPASGMTTDWVYLTTGCPYSTLFELRDQGEYGFLLPEDQIIATYREAWNAIKAAIRAIQRSWQPKIIV